MASSHLPNWLYILLLTTHVKSTPLPCPSYRFVDHRCPNNKLSLWVYEGSLVDQDSGRIVADVEGVELVGALPMNRDDSTSLHSPSIGELLQSENWDAAHTLISRKLFCYKQRHINHDHDKHDDADKENNNSELLTSIRLSPDGPLRHLSPSESAIIYDSAITFLSREDESIVVAKRLDGNESNVMGVVETSNDGFEYTINARRIEEGAEIVSLPKTSSKLPSRRRWIQIGKSQEIRKYNAVREKYVYSNNFLDEGSQQILNARNNLFSWITRRQKPSPPSTTRISTVRYTRYGEAPPWYAPGRMCTLDLLGTKLDLPTNIQNLENQEKLLPSCIKWCMGRCHPSFMSGWPTSLAEGNGDIDLSCIHDKAIPSIIHEQEEQSKMENIISKLNAGVEKLKTSLICN